MKDIKFSIIMPCYNSQEYVEAAVESVSHQSYANWELIAVNDGSTDSTVDILQNWAARDQRIKVLQKANGGYSTAINFGLEQVGGDYFLVMGSDDALACDLLTRIVQCMDAGIPDMVLFNTSIYRNGEYCGRDKLTGIDEVQFIESDSFIEFDREYPDVSKIIFSRDTSRCYRTELLGELRYFGKYGIAADEIFSMLFAHRCHSWLCVPVEGYIWNVRNDSVSQTKTSMQKHEDIYWNWKQFYAKISEQQWNLCTKEKVFCARWIRAAKAVCSKNPKMRNIYSYVLPIRRAVKELHLGSYLSPGNRLFLLFPFLIENTGLKTRRYDF